MDDRAVQVIEIESDAGDVRAEVYEVRSGPVGRALAWAALVVGVVVGLLVMIPLMLLGLMIGLALLAFWALYMIVSAIGAAAARRIGGSGRRNVRVVRDH